MSTLDAATAARITAMRDQMDAELVDLARQNKEHKEVCPEPGTCSGPAYALLYRMGHGHLVLLLEAALRALPAHDA